MATTKKKVKYGEKDYKDALNAPCFGEFKPPKKAVKTTKTKKGK